MAEPRTRPPTGEFGESLYEGESNWWDLPVEGEGYAEGPSGRAPATYTGEPFVTSGSMRSPSPRQRGGGGGRGGSAPPFYGQFLASKPSGPSPRFQDFHLESIERGLKQAITLKGLREQLTGKKTKKTPPDPKTLELATLRHELEKARIKKEIKELRKPPKRTKPTPVWGRM